MPRRFQLTNKTGAIYDLNKVGHAFYDPDGLGWGEETSLLRLGETFLVTENVVQQPVVSGQIVFHSYKEYDDFLKFCQVGGLVLGYMPLTVWRYITCTIQIGKTEIKPDTRRLISDVVFTGTSQWYESTQLQPASGEVAEDAKKYSYKYPYTYSSGASGTITIENGPLSSYFRLVIAGRAENPVWRLYQNSEIIYTGAINATIVAGHKLVVNSRPVSMEIAEYDANNNFYRDLYGYSDFNTTRLFALPPGQSTLAVAVDNGVAEAYLEVYRRV